MLNDHVAVLSQFPDFVRRGERIDGVSRIGSKANSVIENLDAVLADQLALRFAGVPRSVSACVDVCA